MPHEPRHRNRLPPALALAFLLTLLRAALAVDEAQAPDLRQTQSLYNSGEYEEAAEAARIGQDLDPWITEWEIIEANSLMALGRYEDAYQSLLAYLRERSFDLRSRLLLREAARYTGRDTEARRQLEAIAFLLNERSNRFSYDPQDIVAVGQAALLFNVEPKIVLENFFRNAQQQEGAPASAFDAAGRLALDKHDYRLASSTFQRGLELHPDNTELWQGLAASFREGDRSLMTEYAERALRINPRHGPTLVLLAEHLIAAEAYEEASSLLDRSLSVNPLHPESLALKAVISLIRNEPEAAQDYRSRALATFSSNPQVDYTIGRELSKKYRFQEGADAQRAALQLDEDYTPARIQLAQDLLRLGRNQEAWEHAQAVHQADPYDIAAYNLVTLKDKLAEFQTLETEHFILRLNPQEAAVYGARAARLLESAHQRLTERYGLELPQKTTVEIYPDPADFETRTFGMPGNPGFLGVCFGPVFTINSPATRSSNWEAVLYHEFCHTITLALTQNRMPRWLSEGISVFEEEALNPSWGQRMTADYRDRILTGSMQPISNMSAAFLQAEDGEDVQFAYFQSYLVVDFISQRFGMEAIKRLLRALGDGDAINAALAQHIAPLGELNADFAAFAQEQAAQLASDFSFKPAEGGALERAITLLTPTRNYSDALQRAQELIAQEAWTEAIQRLEALIADAGYVPGPQNGHAALAQAYRGAGELEKEKRALEAIVERETHQLAPVVRLLEIAREQEDAAAIHRWSNAWLAINPMAETPWRQFLQSSTELQLPAPAIEAGQALIALDPPDSASVHYQLAQLQQERDSAAAKRHLLMALERAPRYQAAYELLRELPEAPPARQPEDPQPLLDFDPLQGLDVNYAPTP